MGKGAEKQFQQSDGVESRPALQNVSFLAGILDATSFRKKTRVCLSKHSKIHHAMLLKSNLINALGFLATHTVFLQISNKVGNGPSSDFISPLKKLPSSLTLTPTRRNKIIQRNQDLINIYRDRRGGRKSLDALELSPELSSATRVRQLEDKVKLLEAELNTKIETLEKMELLVDELECSVDHYQNMAHAASTVLCNEHHEEGADAGQTASRETSSHKRVLEKLRKQVGHACLYYFWPTYKTMLRSTVFFISRSVYSTKLVTETWESMPLLSDLTKAAQQIFKDRFTFYQALVCKKKKRCAELVKT